MRIDTVAQLLLGGVFAVRVFDTNKPMWARLGFGLVAADALMEAYKGNAAQDATLAGGLSADALASAPGGALGRLSKPLKFEAHAVHSLKARVSKIHQQMISGTRDPKVYELAREVVSRRDGNGNWAVPEKNNRAEAEALFNEVRKRVRYTWDPTDFDAFQTPGRTLEMASADCDDFVSLLGAMCRSIGLNVRSRVIQTKDADTWNHIYLLVNIDGKWLPLDASVNKPAFWEVPKEYVVAVEDFDVKE